MTFQKKIQKYTFKDVLKEASPYLSLLFKVGSSMVFCVVTGFFLGYFFRVKFNTPNGVLIGCVMAGVGIGFYSVYKAIVKLEEVPSNDTKKS